MNAVWITWERHRRSRGIARALDIPLVEHDSSSTGPQRYLSLLTKTTSTLRVRRPSHVFAQCPSVILGLWLTALKRIFGYYLVVDLHNEAVSPFIHTGYWYRRLLARIHRTADLSLVSNEGLCEVVQSSGGSPFVLPDPIPALTSPEVPEAPPEPPMVTFVCSYARDEPYRAVIEAAGLLASPALVYITGDHRRANLPAALPRNVRLTGYLSNADYDRLLAKSSVIVDLTAMENCLVCGAYEAVALAKPLVTSDTAALRAYFSRGVVYTGHAPRDVARAISTALANRSALSAEMILLRAQLHDRWHATKRALLTHLAVR